MILSKMLKQCKKNKRIQIIRYGKCNYLSAGTVAGIIDADVKDWTAEDSAAAIGISDDERDNYIQSPRELAPIKDLKAAAPMEWSVTASDRDVLQPFILGDGRVLFISAELLKIFDSVSDTIYYFSAEHGFIAVVRHDDIMGFICPTRVNLNKMSAWAADLLRGLNASDEAGFYDAGGQMEIIETEAAE